MNKEMDSHEVIKVVRQIEKELSLWKYYDAFKGKSIVNAIYIIYLKYLIDNDNTETENNLFSYIHETLRDNKEIDNSVLTNYIQKRVIVESENMNIFWQYTQRIDFSKLPRDFEEVLYLIDMLDFSISENRKNLTYALLMIASSLYGMHTFKGGVYENDINLITGAVEMLEPDDNLEYYDFSCGAGALLAISATTGSKIYAEEPDFEKAVVAYVILKITGVNDLDIVVGDVLQTPMTLRFPEKLFDRIISAPQLVDKEVSSQKINSSDCAQEFLYGDSLADSGMWIYARHIIKKLKQDGKGILIAPISILSREGATKEDRVRIAERGSIEAIIQLPSGITTVAVRLCIIVLRKGTDISNVNQKIQIVDLSGQKGSSYIRCEDKNTLTGYIDYKKLTSIVLNKQEIDGISKIISLSDVDDENMNLTPAVYLRDINELMMQRENTVDILEKQKEFINMYHSSEKELDNAILNYYTLWGEKYKKEELS